MSKLRSNLRYFDGTISALFINGGCESLSSSSTSLEFGWASSTSEISYRLFGSGLNQTTSTNATTVDSLTPGTRYVFKVWSIAPEAVTSNNITCVDSTGSL